MSTINRDYSNALAENAAGLTAAFITHARYVEYSDREEYDNCAREALYALCVDLAKELTAWELQHGGYAPCAGVEVAWHDLIDQIGHEAITAILDAPTVYPARPSPRLCLEQALDALDVPFTPTFKNEP